MNAIEFLIQEHDKVRQILADIENKSHQYSEKRKIFDGLCHDLIRHETMEETVWYPYFQYNDKLDDEVKHLITEEKHAAKVIKEFEQITSESEFEKKFAKFKKDVEHHANEEETKLFPHVEKLLNETELEEIGRKMREFKENYRG